MALWILLICVTLFFLFSVYINARLFAYIKKLESRFEVYIETNEHLRQSIKELVQDDFLLADGRLKKFAYEKDKNKIYNGITVTDQDFNL